MTDGPDYKDYKPPKLVEQHLAIHVPLIRLGGFDVMLRGDPSPSQLESEVLPVVLHLL